MNLTIQLVAVTILAPAGAAVGVVWLSQQLFKGAVARGSAAFAFAAGFWLGYALLAWLQDRSDFVPARHWQWIPYITLLAAAVGAVNTSSRLHLVVRWTLLLLAALVAAWLIVPTWPDLVPPRAISIPLLAAYFFLITALLEPLSERLRASVLIGHLALTAFASAAMIAAFVSLTYGESATIAAAALAGCAAGAWLFPRTVTIRALALVYAVNISGWAFTGAINPRPPLFALLLTPLAPLALWTCAVGPLARKRGIAAIAIQTAAVLAIIAIAVGWATLLTQSEETVGG